MTIPRVRIRVNVIIIAPTSQGDTNRMVTRVIMTVVLQVLVGTTEGMMTDPIVVIMAVAIMTNEEITRLMMGRSHPIRRRTAVVNVNMHIMLMSVMTIVGQDQGLDQDQDPIHVVVAAATAAVVPVEAKRAWDMKVHSIWMMMHHSMVHRLPPWYVRRIPVETVSLERNGLGRTIVVKRSAADCLRQ